jgi:hypothetical protein
MPYTGEFAQADEARYEGSRFTASEIDNAGEYLAEKQLILGATVPEERGPVAAEITPAGIDCVTDWRGDVSAYVRDQRNQGSAPTTTYHGPVIQGHADGAQLAWNNQTVTQTQTKNQQIAPGFEVIAQAVADTLKELHRLGLPEEDQQDVESLGEEVLAEVTQSEPDRRKIRRAMAALQGFLTRSLVAGAAAGAEQGAEELIKKAVEQIGSSF